MRVLWSVPIKVNEVSCIKSHYSAYFFVNEFICMKMLHMVHCSNSWLERLNREFLVHINCRDHFMILMKYGG